MSREGAFAESHSHSWLGGAAFNPMSQDSEAAGQSFLSSTALSLAHSAYWVRSLSKSNPAMALRAMPEGVTNQTPAPSAPVIRCASETTRSRAPCDDNSPASIARRVSSRYNSRAGLSDVALLAYVICRDWYCDAAATNRSNDR